MTTELENKLSFLGITGGHTPVVDIFRKMAPGYPTPGPAEFSQTPIPSTSASLATDNNNVGRKQPKRSFYTFPSVKSVISEAATAYNRKLRGLNLRVGRLFPGNEVPN